MNECNTGTARTVLLMRIKYKLASSGQLLICLLQSLMHDEFDCCWGSQNWNSEGNKNEKQHFFR